VLAEKLAHYCLLAGEQALASFDSDAALRLFRRGLEAKGQAADDAETAWLRFGVARAMVPRPSVFFYYAGDGEGGTADAFAALTAAYEYFERTGDANSAIRVAEHPLVPVFVNVVVASTRQYSLDLLFWGYLRYHPLSEKAL
jgi:hypothetical protein